MHMRQQIREFVKALLSGKTACEDRVFPSRARPIFKNEYPLICVYTGKQTSKLSQEAPREYQHMTEMHVAISVAGDETIDDQMDELSGHVERLIYQDETLGGLVADTQLAATDAEIDAEGDRLIGACVLTFMVEWYAYAPADSLLQGPETPEFTDKVGPWERTRMEVDLPPADGSPEIESEFDMEQD